MRIVNEFAYFFRLYIAETKYIFYEKRHDQKTKECRSLAVRYHYITLSFLNTLYSYCTQPNIAYESADRKIPSRKPPRNVRSCIWRALFVQLKSMTKIMFISLLSVFFYEFYKLLRVIKNFLYWCVKWFYFSHGYFFLLGGGSMDFIPHCFVCRPSDFTCRRMLGSNLGLFPLWYRQSDALTISARSHLVKKCFYFSTLSGATSSFPLIRCRQSPAIRELLLFFLLPSQRDGDGV